MSRATVRQSVVEYFSPPNVEGLNKIFNAHPKRITGSDFHENQPTGNLNGAVGVVHILSESEGRIAYGGEHGGQKMVDYIVEIQVLVNSREQQSQKAMEFFDAVIDAIKTRLRDNRRLDNYPIIFEAGEKSLNGEYGEPRLLNDGSTEIWGAVKFTVSEVVFK